MHAAHLEGDIDTKLVVHFYVDVRSGELLETGSRGTKLVGAGRQRLEAIGAVRTGSGLLAEIRFRIGDGYARSAHHTLTRVANDAQD